MLHAFAGSGNLSQKDLTNGGSSKMEVESAQTSLFIPANHSDKDKMQKQTTWHKLRSDLILDLFVLACLVAITAAIEKATPRQVCDHERINVALLCDSACCVAAAIHPGHTCP